MCLFYHRLRQMKNTEQAKQTITIYDRKVLGIGFWLLLLRLSEYQNFRPKNYTRIVLYGNEKPNNNTNGNEIIRKITEIVMSVLRQSEMGEQAAGHTHTACIYLLHAATEIN